jgi:SNF2 family DNA or RNA helicase
MSSDRENIESISQPESLRAQLRPYQLTGLGWLQRIARCKLGGILADDMGLGKTVQALAHVLHEKREGRLDRPALVVAPTSVVPNWLKEIAAMAPDLRALSLSGGDRGRFFNQIEKSDLVVTSYPLLLRDAEHLTAVKWHAVLLDEAQTIKNAATATARIVTRLKAGHRICLTGTPVENHLGELWSQLNFVIPGFLGTRKSFASVFQKPIEKGGDVERLDQLVKRVSPFILRRTKEEVAPELPAKTEMVRYIELADGQRDLYETIRLSTHKEVLKEMQTSGPAKSHIVILAALTRLRQACCDPRLVKVDSRKDVKESAKLDYLLSLTGELIEDGRRILIFSQFTSMIDLIKPELVRKHIQFLTLTGDTKDRGTLIDRFQTGEAPIFLISLKAGGTGLNLTAADTVIHYDPWWNPQAENQATDRAHRIGQEKPVFVYKLIARGTIEERILELKAKKKAVADSVLIGAASGYYFDEKEIETLFAPIY